MKIQLKRSNVLSGVRRKSPTAAQTEYGELCVNYNAADPVIFIKDSNNQIIRLTNMAVHWDEIIDAPVIPVVNDGAITIEAGDGLSASGDNASANQAIDTVRTLAAVAYPDYAIDIEPDGIRFGDSWLNVPALP